MKRIANPLYASIEPVLPMTEIQGIVVPGFFKPHQTLIGVTFPHGEAAIRELKAFLRRLKVSTAAQTLQDRRTYRDLSRRKRPIGPSSVLCAAAFACSGLRLLGLDTDKIPSAAFRLGLAARSPLLGDPTSGEGSPAEWKVGGPKSGVDGLLVVAGNDRASVSKCAKDLSKQARSAGLSIVYQENGDVRPELPGHEHFGFSDGISQPGIRGRASRRKNDFITDRWIDPDQLPESLLFGYPGQDLVWPGAFVLGQPEASPDPLIARALTPAVPRWTKNGSFLVFRRLVQDVGLFWRTMRHLAGKLSTKPGFEHVDADWLAARLVGRWPSGAPVNRVPDRDVPALGSNPEANNHFRFDSDCTKHNLKSGYADVFPMSMADPAGITCPWASHIRKTNTRDSGSDTGGRDSTYKRRLLRVGISFGPSLQDRFATQQNDPNFRRRGLLFLSIQASIEDQFEFLMCRWMGDPLRPKTPGGHDMLVGQNSAVGEDRDRRCVIFGTGAHQAEIRSSNQWIIPTGGGYFFVPSISTLRNILGRRRPTP